MRSLLNEPMYIIAIAWGFVVVLMAAAESLSTSVVGGLMTLVFYGAFPMSIFFYLFGTGRRRRNRARREAESERLKKEQAPDH